MMLNVEKVQKGEDALKRLTNSFEEWMEVGEAQIEIRCEAMAVTGSNQPKGKPYNCAFSRLIGDYPLLAGLTAHERKALFDIFANRVDFDDWRSSLSEDERRKYNHPETNWRHFSKSRQPPKPVKIVKIPVDAILSEDPSDNARRWAAGWEQLMRESNRTPQETVALCKISTQQTIEEFLRNHPIAKLQ